MVENILSVTKLHSQSERIILKDIPVRPTVEKVVQLLKTQYKDKNFIVDEKINTPNILADEDKFQQAIMNIIENACKYSNNNDIWINVGFGEDENFVAINVTNLGLGIDERDYEKIFTKFSRIDNPLTRKVQGSGLGLYITKNILEKMGGTICVKSENIDVNLSKIKTDNLNKIINNTEEKLEIASNQNNKENIPLKNNILDSNPYNNDNKRIKYVSLTEINRVIPLSKLS